jgi:type IV pilus assembly protein PilB
MSGRPVATALHTFGRGDVSTTQQLAQILVDEGLVSEVDLARAREEQERLGKSLGRVLIEMGLIHESGLVAALAQHLGLEFVDLDDRLVEPHVAALIPEGLARRHTIMPVAIGEDGRLRVAMSDPSNVLALDDVRTVTDLDVQAVVSTRGSITAAIDRYLGGSAGVGDLGAEMGGAEERSEELEALDAVTDDAPVVRFVNALIDQAVRDRASDIHIEPQEREVRVRYRVDGVLIEVMTQNRKVHPAVVSRLKIMADLDIAERRIPQDGRISLKAGGKTVDLRLSTLPTVYGEKIVMRILDTSSVMLQHNFKRYEYSYRKPYGMILVTGPTGSGKSTTLYATLNVINDPAVNIVTTEDPVEYRLPGISQVQINNKAGLTFPSALRSILRQDPDVVLVGEMRDHETAHIGMEAALTGHLVLSTLHTNDAPSAVTRLTEMGIDPFLVASAVDCVLAQRLVRKLCTKCKEAYEPAPEELMTAGLPWSDDDPVPTLYRPAGCGACANTGYRGRMAVHEVMHVNEEIERLIVGRASTDEIAQAAAADGMRFLREDGLAKVLMGGTTLEEVARVVV